MATQASRYLEIWAHYNAVQVEFREKAKAALAKNIRITDNRLTTEEIEQKIDPSMNPDEIRAVVEQGIKDLKTCLDDV